MKNKSGITLISLVITIIVMLILVAITVNVAMNGGLFNQTQIARTQTDKEKAREQLTSALVGALDTSGILTVERVKTSIESIEGTVIGDVFPLTVEYKGEEFIVTENGINNNVSKVIREGVYIAPIPVGFVVSGVEQESEISNGLVIYQMTEEQKTQIEWTNETQLATAKKTYNQFVWIPINDISNMAVLQSEGSDNYRGVLHDWENDSTGDTIYVWNDNPMLSTETTYMEPIYLNNVHADESSYNKIKITQDLLQKEFNEMVASVKQYKGFYVGRYETGGYNTGKSVVIAGEKTISICNANWYRIYEKTKLLSTNETTARMIWGSQWDQMLKFAECANATTPTIGDALKIETGKVETDCYKNIYDLCGNAIEWTAEGNISWGEHCGRIFRGGCCDNISASSNRETMFPSQNNAATRVSCYSLYKCKLKKYNKIEI